MAPPRVPLPIDTALPELVGALRAPGAAGVLSAPPGSGKTTRVPSAMVDGLGEALSGEVVVLEPRRVAARASARRVAYECGVELGQEVGYQVRHDTCVSAATRIRFVTEGVLVRQMLADPFLERVGAVVLDEFHERHVEGDLALAMLAEVRQVARPDLRVVVMSATLEAEPLLQFLRESGAEPFHVEASGRVFPVTVRYQERPDDRPLPDRTVDAVRDLDDEMTAGEVPVGDMLVFLPGVGEIRAVTERLNGLQGVDFDVLPLHGTLDAAAQDRALTPSKPGARRKVVVATNVAESSLTIPGVTAVIDSGLARVPRHDSSRGLDLLELTRISRASAEQRAGRAGRTAPGACLRMWTRADNRSLLERDVAEIRRVDLAGPVLQLRAFTGGRPPTEFGWFEAPATGALQRADELLLQLGALDGEGRPSSVGRAMLSLPMHPRLARAQLEAESVEKAGLSGIRPMLALATALLAERPLVRVDRSSAPVADLEEWITRFLAVREQRFRDGACRREDVDPRAARSVDQAVRQQKGVGRFEAIEVDGGRHLAAAHRDALARCLLAGFPDRLAVARDRGRTGPHGHVAVATLGGGRGVQLDDPILVDALDGDGLFLALSTRTNAGGGDGRWARAELAFAVALADLEALGEPSPLIEETDMVFDSDRGGSVRGVKRLRFGDLVLRERPHRDAYDPVRAAERMAEALARDPGRWLAGREDIARLGARIEWLQKQLSVDLPAVDETALAEALGPHCAGIDRLSDLLGRPDVLDLALGGILRPDVVRMLRDLAPDRIELPSGRRAEVSYPADAGPTVAARMQELFGLRQTPRLGREGPRLRLELLGPNYRPVQITDDLAGFWQRTWPAVRAELGRRYPKHAWPEDPVAAEPVKARPRRRRK